MIRTIAEHCVSLFRQRPETRSISTRSMAPATRRVQPIARAETPLSIHIGWTEENGHRKPVYLSEADLATHGTILGRTGRGKSKFLQLCVRANIEHQRGFTVVDPKGRTIQDILADLAAHTRHVRSDAILKRVLLIEITPGSVPLLSAMHWQGEPFGDDRIARNSRAAFLAKEADVLIEIIHQMAGEPQDGAPRIKRLLRDVFVALATVKLEFGDAFVLLDPFHSRHDQVWNACRESGLLPAEILADLQMIHELKRPQDVLTQIEGPLNRLRSLLSPLVRACFTDRLKSIDFARVLRDRQIVLVDASESRFVSQFQAKTIAGMIIHRLIEEAANEDFVHQDRRTPHALFIDEAAELMGPDIDRNLRIGRSLKVPTFLFSQNLSAYKREDNDYRETVLNEPGITVAFQSKTADELLTNIFLHANHINFSKATREVDRHDGYDFVALPSASRSVTISATTSRGGGRSKSNQQTVQRGFGETTETASGTSSEHRIDASRSDEVSDSNSRSSSRSQAQSQRRDRSQETGVTLSERREFSQSLGRDESSSSTTGSNRTDEEMSGMLESNGRSLTHSNEAIGRVTTDGASFERVNMIRDSSDSGRSFDRGSKFSLQNISEETNSTTKRRMETDTYSTSEAQTQSRRNGSSTEESAELTTSTGRDERYTASISNGRAVSQSSQRSLKQSVRRDQQVAMTSGGTESENWGKALGTAEGNTQGLSVSPVARYRTEIEELPQLETDIETQRHRLLTQLSTLGVAECFVRNDAIGKLMKVQIREVSSPFTTSTQYYRAIALVKTKLRNLHGFTIEPDLSPNEEAGRLDAFVAKLIQQLRNNGDGVADDTPELADVKGDDDRDEKQEAFG